MDGLPGELCFKIFHLLNNQSLAAAPRVCRKWSALTCDDKLWRKLFEDRWGADATAFYAPDPEGSKPWKDVFVVQDRCDRYGLGVRIIREGNDYTTSSTKARSRTTWGRAATPRTRSRRELKPRRGRYLTGSSSSWETWRLLMRTPSVSRRDRLFQNQN